MSAAPRGSRGAGDRGARPLRVRWLIKGLGPGGAERLLVAAAGTHDPAAVELSCSYLLPWKRQLVPALEDLGVATTCLDVRDERDVRWSMRLRAQLTANPVDILHVHSPYPAGIARLVVPTVPSARRPRTVYTLHNTWGSFARPTRALNGATLRRDSALIAVSALVRDSLAPAAAARTEVVIHGIDLDAVRAQTARESVRAELGLAADDFVFGTVANLRAQKDYPNLLAAADHLRRCGAKVRIVAVGQGPLEAEIRAEHARLGLGDAVLILGERADAVRVMSGCDAFVLASSNEGLPVALMEALALGLPIVATDVGGVSEAVTAGRSGVLVAPRDPVALGDAMAHLATDPAERERLAAGTAPEAARFDVRRTVGRIEEIYRRVAAAPDRRPVTRAAGPT